MSFTAIFIALLLERFVIYNATPLRHWHWFTPYQRMISEKLTGQTPYVLFAALVLPIIVAVILVEIIVHSLLFGFLKLFISLAIIFYCLGPRNLWADIMSCLHAFTEGDTAALAQKLKETFDIPASSDKQTLHRELLTRTFIQANARVFGIVFWYGVVGIVGVVFYRLTALLASEQQHTDETSSAVSMAARRVLGYLDWPSVRALTFLFALGGNYGRVFSVWMNNVMRGPDVNESMLLECGMASLNSAAQEVLPEEGSAEKEEMAVIDRSLVIALVIIAVLVYVID